MLLSLLFAAEPLLTEAPITTGALFVALTGAITYLYRARDRDHDSEVSRLERQVDRLETQVEKLLQQKDNPK